ncbi:protealysin inhibitor emfourin [Myxococcus xanthus]|uniref:Uncharacterized protein n=1 Tax=Myxococcus xanthus TaxID=34 RepID=A0A7Y4MTA1_MYXXA|nr:protealysin inhibitor emfourin [Myxococcus xanthus]NOJ81390.1 hypothetical protein [Myxococcus xanthus]NOJ85822.1 hypothetical protein [Myxococcus xanthus]
MHIEIKREGGPAYFPGLARPREVDLTSLPPEQAEALRQCVQAARFFELPPVVGALPPGAPDARRFTLTVEEGGRRHTVQFIEPVEEPRLHELLEQVTKAERAQRRGARPGTPG